MDKNLIILKCAECRQNRRCEWYKDKYKQFSKEAREKILNKLKKDNNDLYYSYIDQLNADEAVEEEINKLTHRLMVNDGSICKYEEQTVNDIYEELNAKYTFDKNPILKHLAFNIISQLLIHFRLQKVISLKDIVYTKVMFNKMGHQVQVELTNPALPYLMKSNTNVNESLIRFNNVVEGMHIKIDGEFSFKNVMGKIMDIPINKKEIK